MTWVANEYKKPIQVVETDWPSECSGPDAAELSEPSIPASAQGQLEWVHKVIDVVKGLPKGLGQGINYWEPGEYYVLLLSISIVVADEGANVAWLNNTGLGSSCQSAILFEPDWSEFPKVTGYSLPSVNMFENV